jgi:hypothetical protein
MAGHDSEFPPAAFAMAGGGRGLAEKAAANPGPVKPARLPVCQNARVTRIHSVLCLAAGLLAGLLPAGPAHAQGAPPSPPIPPFEELEALGARIGTIRVDPQNIFDLSDPRENNAFFVLANRIHVPTRPEVIERALLFKPGDRVSRQVIDETERVLRANRSVYDVQIRPVAWRDGIVDVEVVTRDTWTLDLTARYSRSGGKNTAGIGLVEYNFLGTGWQVGVSQTSEVDRDGTQFLLHYGQALDGWTALHYEEGRYSDGGRRTASVTRPFYALDTRWAAGASWDDWDRTDSIYNAGDEVAQYRHRSQAAEAFGGWSPGLVAGWTHRLSAGVTMKDDAYGEEPGTVAPVPLPVDHKVRGPFLRYEVIEDRYVKLKNRDLIAKPEFFDMGLSATFQLTRASEPWGSSRSAWLYSASAGRGFALPWGHDLLASVKAQRQFASTGNPLSQAGFSLRYYAPQGSRAAFFAALSGDRLGDGGGAPDQLLLGGDNGLRGYPLRYQSGERRALFTLEQRYYTDWYLFRLMRVGGAVFYDVGRAWGGANQNAENGGWLSDAGFGLRLAFDRAAFGNVLHFDVAFPLDRAGGIEAVQFLVKSKATF